MDWLSLASNIAKFAVSLLQLIQAHRDYTSGYAGATNAALISQTQQMEAAAEEIANADKTHASDSTDTAFDPQFKRSD